MNVHRLCFAYGAQKSLAGRYTHEFICATHSRVLSAPVVTNESMLSIEILVHVEHKGALREGFGYGYLYGLPVQIVRFCLCSSY
jgi:hypothetical protein